MHSHRPECPVIRHDALMPFFHENCTIMMYMIVDTNIRFVPKTLKENNKVAIKGV